MKTIATSSGHNILVDDDDFDVVNQYTWTIAKPSKYSRTVYAYRKVNNKNIYLHREVISAPKGSVVDHIDNNGLNNTKSNLRICNTSLNTANGKKRKSNSSGYKGVYYEKRRNKWAAQIRVNYKKIHLGYFNDKERAAIAYDNAAKLHFGEYADLNFHE